MGRVWTSLLITGYLGLLIAILPACSLKNKESSPSKLTLTFPTTQQILAQQSQKISTYSTYDWARVCYMVNVTADDIPKNFGGSCNIPIGVFVGAIKPGGSVILEIARGKRRKLEVFTFMRDGESTPCPSMAGGFGPLDPLKIVRVGQVPYFDTEESTMTVRVDLQEPDNGSSLVSQYQLPVTCGKSQPPPPTSGTARVGAGQVRQAGGSFIVDGTVSGQHAETVLSGGSYQVQLSRKAQ